MAITAHRGAVHLTDGDSLTTRAHTIATLALVLLGQQPTAPHLPWDRAVDPAVGVGLPPGVTDFIAADPRAVCGAGEGSLPPGAVAVVIPALGGAVHRAGPWELRRAADAITELDLAVRAGVHVLSPGGDRQA